MPSQAVGSPGWQPPWISSTPGTMSRFSRPGRRSAAWCRRFPHEPATRSATRQRPARRARLLHRVPPFPRATDKRGSPPAADPAGHRRATPGRPARSRATALLRYSHLSLGDRIGVARVARRLARLEPAEHDGETFGWLLRRLGSTQVAIDRFWDVFIRPGLNLPSDQASASLGLFTVQTALLGPREASDLLLPVAPLGEMHGDAAGRALEEAGATSCRPGSPRWRRTRSCSRTASACRPHRRRVAPAGIGRTPRRAGAGAR